MAVCGCKQYRISVFLIATGGYKGCRISIYVAKSVIYAPVMSILHDFLVYMSILMTILDIAWYAPETDFHIFVRGGG